MVMLRVQKLLKDADVRFVNLKERERNIWHTSAHIIALTVKRLFRCKFIGPAR